MTQVTATEVTELVIGLAKLKGALSRAAQLGGALELETAKREQLSAQRKDLVPRLEGSGGSSIPADNIYAARIACRLRYAALKTVQANEIKAAVEPNPDVAERITLLETLGLKLGIQLDLIVTSNDPDTTDPDEEDDDAAADE